MVRLGMVRLGSVRFGWVRLGLVRFIWQLMRRLPYQYRGFEVLVVGFWRL